jgi:hypothetical protein
MILCAKAGGRSEQLADCPCVVSPALSILPVVISKTTRT